MIRRAIIALTALAMVLALAVPVAFAQDDVNTATNVQTGQTGAIAQLAQQCVEGGPGDNECLIVDEDNGNGDDGDFIFVGQANVHNEQNAWAFGGEGGDNNAIAVGVGDDLNVGDEGLPTIALLDPNDDEGDDNVAAFNQQQQCQPATASNQIENDAAVQNDTILSNNNAGDVENIGNVCQVGAAVAQQQNDDD